MFWAVVPLSRYTRDYGAVLGITTAYLVPMAAWVPLGRLGGFVRGYLSFSTAAPIRRAPCARARQ